MHPQTFLVDGRKGIFACEIGFHCSNGSAQSHPTPRNTLSCKVLNCRKLPMYIRRLSPPWVAERFYSTAYEQDLEKFSLFVFSLDYL